MVKNVFCWYYCLTMTVIYVTFVIMLAFFNLTTFFIGSMGGDTFPIAYFESFMALWAYLLIPACVVLMWWTYKRGQYAISMLFSFIPIVIIFFTSKLFVTWSIYHTS